MARIAKTKSATDTKATKKVGKLDKAAKPAKPAKPAKENAEPTERKPRGQFAGATVKVTEAGKAATPRGNAGALFDAIVAHKNPADAIGTSYKRVSGKHEGEATITSADLAYFVNRGLLEIA